MSEERERARLEAQNEACRLNAGQTGPCNFYEGECPFKAGHCHICKRDSLPELEQSQCVEVFYWYSVDDQLFTSYDGDGRFDYGCEAITFEFCENQYQSNLRQAGL
jgi:hypothetical protein